MKKITIYTLFLFLISCDRAPRGARQLYMVNNSSQRIVYLSSNSYPDTNNFKFDGCGAKDIELISNPGEKKSLRLWNYWENLLEKIPSKTLMFIVYNADSAANIANNTIGCDSLRKRPDLILKRFDVTLDYLNEHNWELVYP